jgi:hypothetical protein
MLSRQCTVSVDLKLCPHIVNDGVNYVWTQFKEKKGCCFVG